MEEQLLTQQINLRGQIQQKLGGEVPRRSIPFGKTVQQRQSSIKETAPFCPPWGKIRNMP